MSNEHKDALAEGRRQGAAVRRYLEALDAHRPKRGRKRTADSIEKRLAVIEESIGSAGPVERLQMIQERMNLQGELASMGNAVDLAGLEAEFVGAAKGYGDRKGISYAAWRELGVAPDVLRRAGITRGRG
jgi:hypothetical protein